MQYLITGLKNKLDHITDFDDDVVAPSDVSAAVMSSRPELLTLAKRDFSRTETDALIGVIGALLKVNRKLKELCEQLAEDLEDANNRFINIRELATEVRKSATVVFDYDEE